jgi:hypothetical protein
MGSLDFTPTRGNDHFCFDLSIFILRLRSRRSLLLNNGKRQSLYLQVLAKRSSIDGNSDANDNDNDNDDSNSSSSSSSSKPEDEAESKKIMVPEVAKIHANLSFLSLHLGQLEGKAYTRLGAAQEASGFLLDAAESYEKAAQSSIADPFAGCEKSHTTLTRSRRYRKLALIRDAQQHERYAAYLEYEYEYASSTNNEYNAIAVMTERQKEILRMIRKGRVCPEEQHAAAAADGSTEEGEETTDTRTVPTKEQDLILYLTALDAAILVTTDDVTAHETKQHPYTCPGMRAWLIHHAKDPSVKPNDPDDGSSIPREFNIYQTLLDVGNEETNRTYEKYWHTNNPLRQGQGQAAGGMARQTVMLSPNRDFEDSELVGRFDSDPWGPTVTYNMYDGDDHDHDDDDDDAQPPQTINGKFLVGLNCFLLVQSETDALPWGYEPPYCAYSWSIDEQRLVESENSDDRRKLRDCSKLLSEHFQLWGHDAVPAREMFSHQNPEM